MVCPLTNIRQDVGNTENPDPSEGLGCKGNGSGAISGSENHLLRRIHTLKVPEKSYGAQSTHHYTQSPPTKSPIPPHS